MKSQSMTLAAPANAPGMKNRKSTVEESRRLTRRAWTMSASRVTSTVRVTTQMTRKAATCCTAGKNRKSPTTFTKLSSPTNRPLLVNARYRA